MASSRHRVTSPFPRSDHGLALDSGVLDERSVAKALARKGKEKTPGDVIDGLRNGLIVGAGMWIGIFLVVRIFFF